MWISLIIGMLLLIPVWLLDILQLKNLRNRLLRFIAKYWSSVMLCIAGVKIHKNIRENFRHPSYALVSNHQGNFDILVILHALPVIPAFISKIELKKIPFLSIWMKAMDCLFINRSDSAGSRTKILHRLMERGHNPLMLFPEGTRSRSDTLLPFRTGGLKMIYDSRTDVIPVSIKGTYKIWEETKRIKPGIVHIEVKPIYKAEEYSKLGFDNFVKKMKEFLKN
jgi:1-acyl-sn-glycerol-3-phosphate acyltransferase